MENFILCAVTTTENMTQGACVQQEWHKRGTFL